MNTDRIRAFCATPGAPALWDEPTTTLLDLASGKSLRIDRTRLREVVDRTTRDGEAYLLLVFDDGRQLAIAPAGIAWPPSVRNVGPLPGAPAVVCWRDFAAVASQVEHVLTAHPDEAPGREVLDMLRYCIAILDGARDAGFDVGPEERRAESALEEVERRSGKG